MSGYRFVRFFFGMALFCYGFGAAASWATAADASDVQGPLAAEESLEHFQLTPGLEIEVVVAEPDVVDPVAVRFDAQGRMWVVEMRDYPHGPEEGEAPKSRIKVLEDKDGDGRYESVQVFADELLFVTGVQPWKGGAIVTLAGRVAFMKDTDGDGRADVEETWYTGFAEQNSQLRANHPRFALDNHVYIANGLRGGSAVDPRRPDSEPVSLSGKDFRFHPTTFEYEALTGVGQFGLTFDDFGNRFIVSNRNPLKHIVLEDRFIRRNELYAPPAATHDVARAGAESRIYAISEAWTTSNLHAGQFTAACGVLLFRGSALPEEFYGNGFTCDPTGNLVHREILEDNGVTFTSEPAREGVEFLASPDEWFRPVNLTNGPDGALYVVDMYRAVIEHPQFMPEELKERPDLLDGIDRGRIYRIKTGGMELPGPPELDSRSTPQLVELLEENNAWHRETAARLLFERQDREAVEPLEQLATSDAPPRSRIHALWALDGLDALDDQTRLAGLRDPNAEVRQEALWLVQPQLDRSHRLRGEALALSEDSDIRVRFALALILAPVSDQVAIDALAKTTWSGPVDQWIQSAIAIASGRRAAEVAETILRQPPWWNGEPSSEDVELIATLVGLGAQVGDAEALRALRALSSLDGAGAERLQTAGLSKIVQALARRRSSISKVLGEEAEPEAKEVVRRTFARATETALDSEASVERRLRAIELLSYDSDSRQPLEQLALQEPVQAVRVRSISAAARGAGEDFWSELLARYGAESPAVRRAIVDAALTRVPSTSLLLDEIEAGHIKTGELEASHRSRLLKHRDGAVQERAKELIADAVPEDRKKVLADYQVVFEMDSDPIRGKAVFKKNCATCHKIGDLGVNVAPDISDSRTKQPEQLLTDILQPNRAIDANYISYSVLTTDGLSLNGIIANETATSITLRQEEGKEVTLLRSDIELIQSNGVSLMPEGLEKSIPPQEMADLISFIKNWRYLDSSIPLSDAGQ